MGIGIVRARRGSQAQTMSHVALEDVEDGIMARIQIAQSQDEGRVQHVKNDLREDWQ